MSLEKPLELDSSPHLWYHVVYIMSHEYVKALNEYKNIARNHNLNPDLLENILTLSLKGYNKTEISRRVGASRQTIHRYLRVVKEDISGDELQKILIGLVILLGGVYILKNLFGGD